MSTNKHILFVHIPKTAGTSFRIAAEEYFGKENTFYDYSPHANETSKVVIDNIYDAKDPYALYKEISKCEYSFLSGHFPAIKYAALYDTVNIVSFVRNPVEQVISHYNHYKNFNAYDKDLESFINEKRFRNVQSNTLRGKPLSYYGFLGLTEEYNTSIDIFNAMYGTSFSYDHLNKKEKNSLSIEDVSHEILEQIIRLNARDIALYDEVKTIFEQRKALYEKKLLFTHTLLQKVTDNQISGLAFQRESDKAVIIDIYCGDTYMQTIEAKNLRPGQVRNNVPKKGFIGFDYLYEKEDVLDAKLHAFIKETGQEIL